MRVTLTLGKVYLNPEFLPISGNSPLGGASSGSEGIEEYAIREGMKLANNCSELLGRKLEDSLPTVENPCPGFIGRKVRRTLNDVILEERTYTSGLGSIRLSKTVDIGTGLPSDLYRLASEWPEMADEFKGVINDQLVSKGVPRLYASRFFSEVYFPAPIEEMPADLIRELISPLKLKMRKPDVSEHRLYDNIFSSVDGVLVMMSLGKSRQVNKKVRKRVRGMLRMSMDLVLAQRVFYSSSTLWFHGEWSLINGLMLLNPEVLRNVTGWRDFTFGSTYSHLLRNFDVERRFRRYIEGFWLPTLDLKKAVRISVNLFRLGASQPNVDDVLVTLDERECAILQALAAKEFLDGRFMGRLDYAKKVAEVLCLYFHQGNPSALRSCREGRGGLAEKLGAREETEGLSLPEIVTLLSPIYRGGRAEYEDALGKLTRLNLVRSRRVGRKGKGSRTVRIYELVALRRSLMLLLDQVRKEIVTLLGRDLKVG